MKKKYIFISLSNTILTYTSYLSFQDIPNIVIHFSFVLKRQINDWNCGIFIRSCGYLELYKYFVSFPFVVQLRGMYVNYKRPGQYFLKKIHGNVLHYYRKFCRGHKRLLEQIFKRYTLSEQQTSHIHMTDSQKTEGKQNHSRHEISVINIIQPQWHALLYVTAVIMKWATKGQRWGQIIYFNVRRQNNQTFRQKGVIFLIMVLRQG